MDSRVTREGEPSGPAVTRPSPNETGLLLRIRDEFVYYSFNLAAITVYMAASIFLLSGRDMFEMATIIGVALNSDPVQTFARARYAQYNVLGLFELAALILSAFAIAARRGSAVTERFPILTWPRFVLLTTSFFLFLIPVAWLFVNRLIT